jgi:hypothetical protein
MADIARELVAAVENAYQVFSRYRLERPIDLCDQCYPELAAVFAKRPLREVDAHLLSQYVDARACHGYAERMDNDMRYLLPRWLELIAAGEVIGRFGDDDGLVVVMHADWRARLAGRRGRCARPHLRRAVSRCDADARGD